VLISIAPALKADDIKQLKQKFGFNPDATFVVPPEVSEAYHKIAERGAKLEKQWDELFAEYGKKFPNEHAELSRRISGELPEGWEKKLPTYKVGDAAVASRKLSENVLTAIWDVLPELLGGSADLTGSNLTKVKNSVDFQHPDTKLGTYSGRYIRYGVREHGMGAAMNGIAAYGGNIPFGGTFLVRDASSCFLS
jgi:transketolase